VNQSKGIYSTTHDGGHIASESEAHKLTTRNH